MDIITQPPNLYQSLMPPQPEATPPAPKSKSRTKGRSRKKSEPEPEEPPTEYQIAQDDLSNMGPVLVRSRRIHDDYILTLRGDQPISFNRAFWTSSGDDSFVTLYRRTADTWEVIDVCVDDISTVSISLRDESILRDEECED